jgi:hypothetical protein
MVGGGLCGRFATCLWPLYLSYRHQRIMKQRLAALTNVRRLKDLVELNNGYEGIFTGSSFHYLYLFC